jgi:hypothetical protein
MPDPKQSASVSSAAGRSEAKAWIVAGAAWLVPGLGHALQRKWARAVVYFVTVAALVIVGITMHGTLFTSEGAADAFDFLGYLSNLGAGLFYFIARPIAAGAADAAHASGDYGTRFLATAGVLNLLCVLEAYEIARRRKP